MKACDRLRSTLHRSVEGETTPAQALRVARHLDTCTSCRIVAARARRLHRALDAMDDPVAVDDEEFFRSVMAALPSTPPPPPADVVARRLAWLRRKRVHLAGWSAFFLLAGGVAAQSLHVWVFPAGAAMPRFADSPEQASGALSALAALVGVALESLGSSIRIAPGLPDVGLAAATGIALAGLAIAGAGTAVLAAVWRGRLVRA